MTKKSCRVTCKGQTLRNRRDWFIPMQCNVRLCRTLRFKKTNLGNLLIERHVGSRDGKQENEDEAINLA